MIIVNPANPVYNAIIFYIMFMCLLLFLKPDFMYCNKTKRFRSFGTDKDCTLLSLPVMSILTAIILYFIFLTIDILHTLID